MEHIPLHTCFYIVVQYSCVYVASPAYIDVRVKLGMALLPAQKETRRRRKEKKVHQGGARSNSSSWRMQIWRLALVDLATSHTLLLLLNSTTYHQNNISCAYFNS